MPTSQISTALIFSKVFTFSTFLSLASEVSSLLQFLLPSPTFQSQALVVSGEDETRSNLYLYSKAMLKIEAFTTKQRIFFLRFGAFQVQIHALVEFQTSALFGGPVDYHPLEDSISY